MNIYLFTLEFKVPFDWESSRILLEIYYKTTLLAKIFDRTKAIVVEDPN